MQWQTLLLTLLMLPEVYQQKKHHHRPKPKTGNYYLPSFSRAFPLEIERFKFMAAVVAASEGWTYWRCAATIIAKHWAVTTAECIQGIPEKLFKSGYFRIRGNTTFLQGVTNDYVDHIVGKCFIHNNYVGDINMYDDNIALLQTKVGFTGKNEHPVNLPLTQMSTATYTTVSVGTVLKWKDMMLKAENVTITDFKECRAFYRWLGKHVSEKMFCAQAVFSSPDLCYGAKGGPLIIDRVFIGIVSYSEECATDHFPATFTKIEHFVYWINRTMEAHEPPPDDKNFFNQFDY